MEDDSFTSFTYYFWLPAGKDEFGFRELRPLPPLLPTGTYRSEYPVEETISKRLADQLGDLEERSRIAGLRRQGDLEVKQAPLGMRKIQYEFEYKRAHDLLRMSRGDDYMIHGRAAIYSNGLYMWTFDMRHANTFQVVDLISPIESFLRGDFVRNYISTVFEFERVFVSSNALDKYAGILSYYQLDLLFNGLFDYNSHPHNFMPSSTDIDEDVYSVQHVVESMSMVAVGRHYRPLFDRRKEYSLLGSLAMGKEAFLSQHPFEDEADQIRALDEFELVVDPDALDDIDDIGSEDDEPAEGVLGRTQDPPAAAHDRRERMSTDARSREYLLSRITYSAIEQFLRVAITFGLTHYRAGLDYCRIELTEELVLSTINRSSGEFRRPSLSREGFMTAEIEAYHAQLAAKLPALRYIEQLVEDMKIASQPVVPERHDDTNIAGHAEWTYSGATLDEAMRQFSRQIDALEAGLNSVERRISAERSERVLAELTESRKIAEVESESPDRETVSSRREASPADNEVMRRLTLLAIVLAVAQVYSSFAVYMLQVFISDTPLPTDVAWYRWLLGLSPVPLGVIAMIGILAWLSKHPLFPIPRQRKNRVAKLLRRPRDGEVTLADVELTGKPGKIETHVYDYSIFREDIDSAGAEALVGELAASMPELNNSRRPCAMRATFRETPSNGIERVKYSLHSQEDARGVSYILHVEVDGHIGEQNEQLRDLRLAFRTPAGLNYDTYAAARHVVRTCIKTLLRESKNNDRAVDSFCRDRFGWPERSEEKA